VLSISPLLAWFFTFILVLLAGRATARLVLARGHGATPGISSFPRNRELGHAAMSFGMALLLVPGLPRPPQAASVGFFAVLAALAALDWGRRAPGLSWLRLRGREAQETCAGTEGGHLLDPHHAIVGVAMVVMLLRPGMASNGAGVGFGAGIGAGTGSTATGAVAMPGMVMGAAPSTTVLLLLAYVWLAALVLGVGMTRVLATNATTASASGSGSGSGSPKSGQTVSLLSSPPTVYACELAMTVLTGLMLLS
jgi:hypothetical protein